MFKQSKKNTLQILFLNMSYFQSLPDLISSKIFKHFLYSQYKSRIILKPSRIWLLIPLLWSCHNWRDIAICYLFEKQELRIGKGVVKPTTTEWPNDLDIPVAASAFLATSLKVHISFPVAGIFLKTHSGGHLGNIPKSMMFLNAGLLIVKISAPGNSQSDSVIDECSRSNFGSLLRLLKQMAPNAHDLDLQILFNFRTLSSRQSAAFYSEFVRSIVSQVAKRKLEISFLGSLGRLSLNNMHSIGSLTHLLIENPARLQALELVRRCAETLQVLGLSKFASISNLSGIIKDDRNNNVVYPNLKHLHIQSYSDKYANIALDSFPGAIPFPNLQSFKCPDGYPFGDHVGFRGNKRTLKHVCLNLDPRTIRTLIRKKVFSATSHPNLHQVMICQKGKMDTQYSNDECAQFLYNISKNSADLTLAIEDYDFFKPQHFVSYQLFGQHQLQILCIDQFFFGISDIVLILESLPSLVEFGACLKPMEEPDVPMNHIQHLQHLAVQHYLLAPNLRTLCVLDKNCATYEGVKTMLALVVLCPSVDVLKIEHMHIANDLQDYLVSYLDRWGYRGYVARFEALKIIPCIRRSLNVSSFFTSN